MKYSLPEIERRWIVDLSQVELKEFVEIEDLYIEGTRLRLRKMGDPAVYKLCKKYGKVNLLSEPISNLYLTEDEWLVLRDLPGRVVKKRRYRYAEGSIDIYAGLSIYEVEFSSEEEAEAYIAPAFVLEEITGNPVYAGNLM